MIEAVSDCCSALPLASSVTVYLHSTPQLVTSAAYPAGAMFKTGANTIQLVHKHYSAPQVMWPSKLPREVEVPLHYFTMICCMCLLKGTLLQRCIQPEQGNVREADLPS
jgi:hypothetical protein